MEKLMRFGKSMRQAALVLLGVFCAASVSADGGGGGSSGEPDDTQSQPGYLQGVAAINEQRWPDAIRLLRAHVLQFDRDADGHNWLAYSYRKSGRLKEAFAHYRRALAIDRSHLGAHEYIGEAYLMANQPDEARKHLRRLAELCGVQCEQYKDLAAAIDRSRVSAAK
jgi:tetratricopeptide (TPR) repeat protein